MQAQSLPFTIKGKIQDIQEPATVYLTYESADSGRQKDSTVLVKGNFTFAGSINKPHKVTLMIIKDSDPNPQIVKHGSTDELTGVDGMMFYLDQGTNRIEGNTLSKAAIKGSKAHQEYLVYKNKNLALLKSYEAPFEQWNGKTEEQMTDEDRAKRAQLVKDFRAQSNAIRDQFIAEYPKSYVSWNMVVDNSSYTDIEKQKKQLESFGPKFLNTDEGQKAMQDIEMAIKLAIGQPAPLFTLEDVNGKSISLEAFRGKYVFIDFWASWCGPCRAENPHVAKAYEAYKDKNFEAIGISTDRSREAWLKALKEDGTKWIHVIDKKERENNVANKYNVRSIPSTWLIDPTGKIIAKDLRGEDLQKKLAEIFK